MKTIYLETSALLRWILGQDEADAVRRTIDRAELVLTSEITFVETERALLRAEAEGSLKGGDAQRLRGLLRRVESSWMRMTVSGDVLARASRPFPIEPVRTLDAIHLATALEFASVFPDLRVSSYDLRVRDNAESLGLA